MTNFQRFKKQLEKWLKKAEEEAIEAGVDITSPEFLALLLELKKKILATKGLTLEEFERLEKEEEERKELEKEDISTKLKVIKLSKNLTETEKEVKKLSEQFREELDKIKKSQLTAEDVRKMMPEIKDYSSEIREIKRLVTNDLPHQLAALKKEKEELNQNILQLQNSFTDLVRQIREINNKKIPKPKPIFNKKEADRIKELAKVDLEGLVQRQFNQLMPGPLRQLAMGLQNQIESIGTFAEAETPSGTINGSNKDFTLTYAPNPVSSLQVFVNGMYMTAGEDYTLSNKTITFNTAPPTNSIIRVYYRH